MTPQYDDLETIRVRLEEAVAFVESLPCGCDARERAARAVEILDRCLADADQERAGGSIGRRLGVTAGDFGGTPL